MWVGVFIGVSEAAAAAAAEVGGGGLDGWGSEYLKVSDESRNICLVILSVYLKS